MPFAAIAYGDLHEMRRFEVVPEVLTSFEVANQMWELIDHDFSSASAATSAKNNSDSTLILLKHRS